MGATPSTKACSDLLRHKAPDTDSRSHLLVVPKLVFEALPGALVRVRDDHIVRVGQLLEPLPQQRDAALEQRQHCVAEVEAFLRRQSRVAWKKVAMLFVGAMTNK